MNVSHINVIQQAKHELAIHQNMNWQFTRAFRRFRIVLKVFKQMDTSGFTKTVVKRTNDNKKALYICNGIVKCVPLENEY